MNKFSVMALGLSLFALSCEPVWSQNAAPQTAVASDEPVFSASSLLDSKILRQPSYQIDEKVPLREHRYQFQIRSQHGTFSAAGVYMLEKRLREIHAIDEVAKMADGPVVIKEALQTLRTTPDGAETLLADPVGTLKRLPRGFERLAADRLNRQDRRAGGSQFRHLALSLGVDPETRNPVLRNILSNVSQRQAIGSAASKYALGAAVPGLGLLATLENFKQTVAEKSPHEISAEVNARLFAANVWEPVGKEFAYSPRYTSMEKLAFLHYFDQLKGVEGIGLMVLKANKDSTEADILMRLAEMRLLAELHKTSTVKNVLDYGLPIAVTADDRIIGVCSVDYLLDSSSVRRSAVEFRKANPNRDLTLLTTGYPSPRAAKVFADAQIRFQRVGYASAAVPAVYQARGQSNTIRK